MPFDFYLSVFTCSLTELCFCSQCLPLYWVIHLFQISHFFSVSFRVKALLNPLLNLYHSLLISLSAHPHLASKVLLKWPFENKSVIVFSLKNFVVRNLCCLVKRKVKVKSLCRVWLFATSWTVACQALLSMRFSRQECWSVLPFPTQGSNPGLPHCRQVLYLLSHQG